MSPFFEHDDDTIPRKARTLLIYAFWICLAFGVSYWSGFLDY